MRPWPWLPYSNHLNDIPNSSAAVAATAASAGTDSTQPSDVQNAILCPLSLPRSSSTAESSRITGDLKQFSVLRPGDDAVDSGPRKIDVRGSSQKRCPWPSARCPSIPMNRIQPDPEARFQRFGANNSQLYGKPMVGPVTPKAQTSQSQPTVVSRTTLHRPPYRALLRVVEELGLAKFHCPRKWSPGYSRQAETHAGTVIVPQGFLSDTKA